MGDLYSKTNLIAELSRTASISRRRTEAVLESLAQIAYREAPKGFTVPGICRLDVVHRQARRARNPSTGETLLIAEHDALRVRPLRKAKQAVAPSPVNLVQVVPAGTAAPAGTPRRQAAAADAASSPAATGRAPAPAPAPTPADKFISFRCRNCSQEIEAPLDMAGSASECPSCGNTIEVPFASEPGTLWGGPLKEQAAQPQAPSLQQQEAVRDAMKSRTIRIELPDDF
jgi:nucleoid DNA-binding protein